MNDIEQYVGEYFKQGQYKNARYKSWEHCYNFFRDYRPTNDEQRDLASLNLAFYLASWGMYRGSSFLLQRDYKVMEFIVDIVMDDNYEPLWSWDFTDSSQNDECTDLVIKLSDSIEQAVINNVQKYPNEKAINPRPTLLTKIILGTLACAPAYDTFVSTGLQKRSISNYYGRNSFLQVINFYQEHIDEFNAIQEDIEGQSKQAYPAMKLVDMYFFKLGQT